ncbi:unnamed protein product [Notodromas monacha]|uniref:Peptidase S9A N-terminal domain-containing protein n=1 Tax=Notodromas monacha TaxID=399045 RepID=A0A7R9GJ47_9CRUS|nr:unnamed protein product [Notodromas monacha]CAG0923257.1 unnamed protein product [Notodromas monacha]
MEFLFSEQPTAVGAIGDVDAGQYGLQQQLAAQQLGGLGQSFAAGGLLGFNEQQPFYGAFVSPFMGQPFVFRNTAGADTSQDQASQLLSPFERSLVMITDEQPDAVTDDKIESRNKRSLTVRIEPNDQPQIKFTGGGGMILPKSPKVRDFLIRLYFLAQSLAWSESSQTVEAIAVIIGVIEAIPTVIAVVVIVVVILVWDPKGVKDPVDHTALVATIVTSVVAGVAAIGGIDDPYRWLEDPDSEETQKFVDAQNAISLPYIHACPIRDDLLKKTTDLWNFPRFGVPRREGNRYFYLHNSGIQNQEQSVVLSKAVL